MLRKVLACYILLVYDLELTTPCWSATSSLLRLNQWGGGKAPLAPLPPPPPQKRQCHYTPICSTFQVPMYAVCAD